MTMKEALIGLAVTIIGGVAVYWFTTGLQEERQREEQRQELVRQQEEAAKQRELAQQQADAERQRREEEERRKQPRMSEVEMDINRDGDDYKDFVAADVSECLAACAGELKCQAITFRKSSRQCWMKSTVPLRKNDVSYISAVKVGAQ